MSSVSGQNVSPKEFTALASNYEGNCVRECENRLRLIFIKNISYIAAGKPHSDLIFNRR